MSDKDIQKMINNGELGVMTECAYGSAVADSEKRNSLKKDLEKFEKEEADKFEKE